METIKKILVLWCLAVLVGCGGGGSPSNPPQPLVTLAFWASDFTAAAPAFYQTPASKVAEGSHCYVYLEQGQSVSQTMIDAIRDEFDNNIYPNGVAGFGNEPNPGVDGDPKIYILLLNVRDGFSPATSSSYIAGYFDPRNEYAQAQSPSTNQREILYLNINRAPGIVPGNVEFFATMAHEFQHMIHWEQKTHRQNVQDETWLDEAMATVARTYCGYGPDYDFVLTYEHDPANSLTGWNGAVEDYGVVYMWAQYLKDRVGGDIFRRMLQNSQTGIASVNAALSAASYPKDFTGTFRDWAVANYVGDGTTVPVPLNNPQWSYASINTWPGTYGGVTIPGLFPPARQDVATLQQLGSWSVNYYSYTPLTPPAGSVAWTPATTSEKGSFVNGGDNIFTYDMTAGTAHDFTTRGYLIVQNPGETAAGSGASVVRNGLATFAAEPAGAEGVVSSPDTLAKTPMQLLAAANSSPVARKLAAMTGRPRHLSVSAFFRERERMLRATGARPPF